jgi:hypothetical protein
MSKTTVFVEAEKKTERKRKETTKMEKNKREEKKNLQEYFL